ncbi:MAG: prepilin-type N-terminal cleavage/methylation domain-containing protein [Acidobacteriota bacterium]|nr:prepilin-type N-terminal cleavage/methylation domain-containing protein [Acidobacteriota bacterium]
MRIDKTRERGFSLVELLIVLVVLILLVSFAVVSTARTRDRVRLADGTRTFGNYLEKARTDSIRRHADSGSQASVQVLNSTTYRVSYDKDSDGSLGSTDYLDVTLPSGVTFVTSPAPATASYTWQGRVTSAITYTLQNSSGTSTINISTAGDVTMNSTASVPATTATPWTTPTPTPTPGLTPTPTPTPANLNGCSVTPSPSSISIRKSGKTTGTIYITGSNYGSDAPVTLTYNDPNSLNKELKVTLSPGNTFVATGTTVTASASAMVTLNVVDVKGANNNYTTSITFSSVCGDNTVSVDVNP